MKARNFKNIINAGVLVYALAFSVASDVRAQTNKLPFPVSVSNNPTQTSALDEGVGAFRGGNIVARFVEGGTTPNIEGLTERLVEFQVRQVWKADSLYATQGFPIKIMKDGAIAEVKTAPVILDQGLDSSGEPFNVIEYKVSETYTDQEIKSMGGCLWGMMEGWSRDSGLVNAPNEFFRVGTVFDAINSTESAVVSAPLYMELQNGMQHTIPLPISTNDPHAMIKCAMADYAASGLNNHGPVSVDMNCILNVDLRNTPVNSEHAAQVSVRLWVPGSCAEHQGFDLIVRTVDVNDAPVCNSSVSGNITAPVGQAVNASFTGTDPDGDPLTVTVSGLPSGAVFTPASGTNQASPLVANFSWTPAPVDELTQHSVIVTFSDSAGSTDSCALNINTPEIPKDECTNGLTYDVCGVCGGNGTSCCLSTDQTSIITSLDGNAFAQHKYLNYLVKYVLKNAQRGRLSRKDLQPLAVGFEAFQSAWVSVNTIPRQTSQCDVIFGSCIEINSADSLNKFLSDTEEIKDISLKVVRKISKQLEANFPSTLKKNKNRVKKFRNKVIDLFEVNVVNASSVNTTTNQCSL